MSVPAGHDFCAQLGEGPAGIGADGDGARGYPGPGVGARKERRAVSSGETWRGSRSGGKSGARAWVGGLLGWREEGLEVEGRGVSWKCQWSGERHCMSLDGGEHPTVAPLSKSGR